MTTSPESPAESRPVPLYVPTLTEALPGNSPAPAAASVLSPAPSPAPPPPLSPAAPAPLAEASPTPVSDAAVQALLQNLNPALEQAITEAIARVLHEQLLGFGSRVQKAVAEVTRESVRQALAQGLHPKPPADEEGAA